jgi:hypothetical protein
MTMKTTESDASAERILPGGAVAELVRLNRDYLDLIIASPGDSPVPLPLVVLQGLRAASAEALDAMAACSYGLFVLDTLRVGPADAPQATYVKDPVAERYGTGFPEGGAWPAFTMAALSFAWQLSRQNLMSVRIMLGLSGTAAASMAAMDPWKLRSIAARQALPLQPRWSRNPCFWPDLLRSAGALDPLRLDLAKLLGMQLLAADLHPWQGSPGRRRG